MLKYFNCICVELFQTCVVCVRTCVSKCVRGVSCSMHYIRTVDRVRTCLYCIDTGIKFGDVKYRVFHNVLCDYKHL